RGGHGPKHRRKSTADVFHSKNLAAPLPLCSLCAPDTSASGPNMQTSPVTSDLSPIRIAGSHGYRIEGDTAFLNADLLLAQKVRQDQWALQLWACEQPHCGGRVSGFKVAEAPLELSPDSEGVPQHVEAQAFARLPADRRDYSMVLVVASGFPG